jgi:hypothetical protein
MGLFDDTLWLASQQTSTKKVQKDKVSSAQPKRIAKPGKSVLCDIQIRKVQMKDRKDAELFAQNAPVAPQLVQDLL